MIQETPWTRRKWKGRGAADGRARGTYAYWFLRRLGYIFIARNYMASRAKGEIDLIGYDGDTLAIVDVRMRRTQKDQPAQPELSVTREKREVLVRTAHYFLGERHLQNCPVRCRGHRKYPGQAPAVPLHKAALSPQVSVHFH